MLVRIKVCLYQHTKLAKFVKEEVDGRMHTSLDEVRGRTSHSMVPKVEMNPFCSERNSHKIPDFSVKVKEQVENGLFSKRAHDKINHVFTDTNVCVSL